ncbi:MAG: hypothetical protein KBT04_06930, partial [Bacteroidales bacterium]|nr:hypothetical protein [Candidatus Colimorpha onthohippi]
MAFITHSLVKRSWSVFLLLLLLFVAPLCHAQVAGLNSYAALRLTPSPYAAALGMDYISKYDASIEGALCNPALINAQFHAGQMALSYMGLSQGTNFATVAYGWQHQRLGTFVFGLRYCSYGRFDGYD